MKLMPFLCVIGLALSEECYRPEIPANSVILPDASTYSDGDNITYTCTYGYVPVEGEITRTCSSGGWSSVSPLCLPVKDLCTGYELDGKCLYVVSQAFKWDDAKSQCGESGELVMFSDRFVKTAAVKTLLSNPAVDEAWIAGHSTRLCWHWTDGTPITDYSWADGEPNKFMGEVEYTIQLRMHADYEWNDAARDKSYENYKGGSVNKFICEYPENCDGIAEKYQGNPQISVNNSCFVFMGKEGHDKYDSKCTLWHEDNKGHKYPNYWVTTLCPERGINWMDSMTNCEGAGGRLAQLASREINENVTNYIKGIVFDQNETKFGGNYWIGGSLNMSSTQFTWRWSYIPGAGSDLVAPIVDGYGCGKITSGGTLSSVDCDEMHPSLCTKDIGLKKCGSPPMAKYTKPIPYALHTPGDTLTQECLDGYQTVRASTCRCTNSGRWNRRCSSSVTCQAQSTSSPPTTSTTTPSAPQTPLADTTTQSGPSATQTLLVRSSPPASAQPATATGSPPALPGDVIG